MEITTIIGFALISLFLYGILRQYSPNYALLLSVVCGVFLLVLSIVSLTPVLEFANKLAAYTSFGNLSVIFKAVAIAILAQFTADLCKEAGQISLAGSVELIGKTGIIIVCVPLFTAMTDIILELL